MQVREEILNTLSGLLDLCHYGLETKLSLSGLKEAKSR